MDIEPGSQLGNYEIHHQLGAGGMGKVYFARDTRLGRFVALKILSPALTTNKAHLHRFEQEARATSTINHPNILTIYEIGNFDSTIYIAAEFIDGLTLRQRLQQDVIRTAEALNVAAQVSTALVMAHEKGIVHRDIKPENIMLRKDGYVKVLDFGLAKLVEGNGRRQTGSEDPTVTNIDTDPGSVIGTIAYMSPEQLRGQKIDGRTDIWSLGVVLYEMASRCLPFNQPNKSDLIVSILEREPPPILRHAPEVTPELQRICSKALSKNRDERYQTADELLEDLKRLKEEIDLQEKLDRPSSSASGSQKARASADKGEKAKTAESLVQTVRIPTSPPTSAVQHIITEIKRHSRGVITLLIILLAVLAGLLTYKWASAPGHKQETVTPKMSFTRLTTNSVVKDVVISPDGKYIATVTEDAGKQAISIRQTTTATDIQIVPPSNESYRGLTFSRDGNYIYYLKEEGDTETLFQVSALGGASRKLVTDVSTPPAFSPDGNQLAFVRKKGETRVLVIANADGTGGRELATSVHPNLFGISRGLNNSPAWSPDGKVLICPISSQNEPFHMDVAEVQVADGSMRMMNAQPWYLIGRMVWLADGSGLIMNAEDKLTPASSFQLWLLSFPKGEARPITNDLNFYRSVSLTSDSSTLLTTQSLQASSIWMLSGDGFNQVEQIQASKNKGLGGIGWTPDGRIIYVSNESGNQEIWTMEANGSNQKQLTFDNQTDVEPVASPDGRYVVFVSYRSGGNAHIWRMNADGTDQKQLTFGNYEDDPQISPDGQWVVYHGEESSNEYVWKIQINGGTPVKLTDTQAKGPIISPDGKLIACFTKSVEANSLWNISVFSSDSGQITKTFDVQPATAQQWYSMRWSADGRALTYVVTHGGISNLWSQQLAGGATKQLTNFKEDQIYAFAWAGNGRQVACVRGSTTSKIVLIRNFR